MSMNSDDLDAAIASAQAGNAPDVLMGPRPQTAPPGQAAPAPMGSPTAAPTASPAPSATATPYGVSWNGSPMTKQQVDARNAKARAMGYSEPSVPAWGSFAAAGDRAGLNLAPSLMSQSDSELKSSKEARDAMINAHPAASWMGWGAGTLADAVLGSESPLGYAALQGGLAPAIDEYNKGGIEGLASNIAHPLTEAGSNVAMQYLGGKLLGEFAPKTLGEAADAAKKLGVYLPAGLFNHVPTLAQTSSDVTGLFRKAAGSLYPTSTFGSALQQFYDKASSTARGPMRDAANWLKSVGINGENFDPVAAVKAMPSEVMSTFKKVMPSINSRSLPNMQESYFGHFFSPDGATVPLKNVAEKHVWNDTESWRMFMRDRPDLSNFMNNVSDLAKSTTKNAKNLVDEGYNAATSAAGKAGGGLWDLAKKAGSFAGIPLAYTAHYLGMPLEGVGLAALAGEAPAAARAIRNKVSTRNIGAPSEGVRQIPEQAIRLAKSATRQSVPGVISRYVGEPIHNAASSFVDNALNTAGDPRTKQQSSDWWHKNAPYYLGGNQKWMGMFNQGGRVAYKKGGKVSPHIEPLVQDLMSRYKHAKKAETATTKPLLQHHDKAIVKALNIAKKAI